MTIPSVRVEATDLVVRYSQLQALDIQRLGASGTVLALLGHNGAGKSTLIKTILGLLEPQRGSVRVVGADGSLLVAEHDMAFCPETGAVFADISVEHYLALWCRIKHGDGSYYRREGSRYVERLAVAPLLLKKGRELSKGQRRRVQTAIGFMSDPRLFLFDEPFDGLDVQRTNELMEIVNEERHTRCFLISSHRMDVMERVADDVIVLQEGRLRCEGPLRDVCAELSGTQASEHPLSLTDAMRHHLACVAK
jgi:ABC-type multidrug transport system ATPase subunit